MARLPFRFRNRRGDLREEAVASPSRRRAPRIIGQDRHKLLTHAERAGWIGGKRELLSVWRDYAEHFIRSRPLLSPEERSWLMSRGFSKDAAWLYDLPGEHAERYISDLQRRLMPQINGLDAPLLANRTLFMQAFRTQLPWPVPLAHAVGGRIMRDDEGIATWLGMADGRRACTRPAFVADGAVTVAREDSDALAGWAVEGNAPTPPAAEEAGGHDTQLLGLPPAHEWFGESERVRQHRFKLLLLRHPRTRRFGISGACLVLGSQSGGFVRDTVSVGIDPADGRLLAAVHRLQDRTVPGIDRDPWEERALPSGIPPGWGDFTARLLEALDGLPLLQWLQVEADLSTGGFTVVDSSDQLDTAAFQVHAPLMEDAACRRFIMEYCV